MRHMDLIGHQDRVVQNGLSQKNMRSTFQTTMGHIWIVSGICSPSLKSAKIVKRKPHLKDIKDKFSDGRGKEI